MERITGQQAKSLMEAVAAVYEKKGEDCVPKSEKGDHNCAKKVCHEEFGQGETIFGQHAEPDENGFVSHYDVQFEHGIVENVSVEDLEVLTMEGHGGHKKKTMYAHTEVEGELVLENDEYEKLDENLLQLLTRNRTVYRRDPETGQKIKVDQQRDPKNLDRYIDKKTTGTSDYGYRRARPGEPGDGTFGDFRRRTGPNDGPNPVGSNKPAPKPQPRPQSPSSNLKPGNPNVVVSPKSGEETKFERRLPTSAELRAAQAARKAATAGGASKKEAEYQAVKAGVGVSKGTVKDPKIAADAARKAKLAALQAKAKADTMAKAKTAPDTSRMSGRARARMEEVDIFDTIKEYLIGEGATEEEALQQMLTLTDEQRTEIIEGSCGSKPKKKGGKK
tara:strand:- start:636 stop:1805 length:1170 start_codon:yes stop_codon:yes gene_type:complete